MALKNFLVLWRIENNLTMRVGHLLISQQFISGGGAADPCKSSNSSFCSTWSQIIQITKLIQLTFHASHVHIYP